MIDVLTEHQRTVADGVLDFESERRRHVVIALSGAICAATGLLGDSATGCTSGAGGAPTCTGMGGVFAGAVKCRVSGVFF